MSNQPSQIATPMPAALSLHEPVAAQTENAPFPLPIVGQGDPLSNALAILLIALIGLVAVARRRSGGAVKNSHSAD